MARPNFQQSKQSGGMRQSTAATQARLAKIAEQFRVAYATGDYQGGAYQGGGYQANVNRRHGHSWHDGWSYQKY